MKENEDRRIIKTRKSIKDALVALMSEKPFEKITVKEICERAYTSRITFYNYYSDKYALLDDVMVDLNTELAAHFEQMQKSNNRKNDPVVSFQNLQNCFLDIRIDHEAVFSQLTLENNTNLLPASYYHFIVDNTTALIRKYFDQLKPKYPVDQTGAFIVCGMYGYLSTARTNGMDMEQIREQMLSLMEDLIGSSLFSVASEGKQTE